MDKIFLPIICGPTASGKTSLSIELAKAFDGEIISADSMQIYTGMDIATAKPDEAEMQGIPHHLIGIIPPTEKFSVADYKVLADRAIADVALRGKLPIMAGGTGLYIDTVAENITFSEEKTDFALRERLKTEAKALGNAQMHKRLASVDPVTAARMHENNIGRIIRALEVYEQTGIPMSVHKKNSRKYESPYCPLYIGLDYRDREVLYKRINLRVDMMLKDGLVEEAKRIYDSSKQLYTSYQAIGYKELSPYFSGEKTLSDCVEILKLRTRQYAKRQLTWFRRNEKIHWIYPDEEKNNENVIKKAKKLIENFSDI